ncbi:hypothetical protein ABS784_17120, partial [Geobacillus sp. G4]|uniref:hypothetical protein n=1 Tax=unclassified Geobacillus TaxID=2642459 RepID=UPI001C8F27D7
RALALQARGRRFDPVILHHLNIKADLLSHSSRVVPTHPASLNQLVEEEATDNNTKSIVNINLLSYHRGVEQSGSSSGS